MTSNHWNKLTAGDVMRTDILTVSEGTPLSEVERLLNENRVGGLPVTNETGHITGVVSIRDLVDRYTQDPDARPRRGHGFYHLSAEDLEDGDLEAFELPEEAEETVGDIMTAQVYAVETTTSVRKVAAKMVELNVHRLLVTEQQKTVGIVSTMDVLNALAESSD
ncbi:MAG: CBS domain-containing protein [Planctomycetota bacterium]|jgi:CBS domain-containing protein